MKSLVLYILISLAQLAFAEGNAVKKPEQFFANNLNRSLVAAEVGARMFDGFSTHQMLTDPCRCIHEKGSFYGLFPMWHITSSEAGFYAYSLGYAAAQIEISRLLWHRSQRSKHKKLFRFASRAVLIFDATNESVLVINNRRLIATRGKHGMTF